MLLAQAEAVADLISARTESAAASVRRQISGEFSRTLQPLRDDLISLAAEISITLLTLVD